MKYCLAWLLLCSLLLSSPASADAKGGDIVIPELKNMYRFDLPDNEAIAFAQQLKIGWNLGNTFDANQDGSVRNDMALESSWVGVKTSREMIEAVKAAGFETIRIPVSWHNHVSGEDFAINQPWLDRVQEVVDWALAAGLHVILNTHHDVSPDYYYPSNEHLEGSKRYIRCIWEQLCQRFKDYDNRLIFESMNEPRLKGTDIEWWFNGRDPRAMESAECINVLNQLFVDTVRASGGNNADRFLMVPGYCAAPAFTVADYFRLPQDTVPHRLIISAHAYTPYDFALDMKGTDKFNAFGAASIRDIVQFMNDLYKRFIANGVPVVIGEFGAMEKNGNLQSRVDFAAYYVAAASIRGIPCVWWDNHIFKGNGERFGLLDRKNVTWPIPEILEALMTYAGYDKMPVKPE